MESSDRLHFSYMHIWSSYSIIKSLTTSFDSAKKIFIRPDSITGCFESTTYMNTLFPLPDRSKKPELSPPTQNISICSHPELHLIPVSPAMNGTAIANECYTVFSQFTCRENNLLVPRSASLLLATHPTLRSLSSIEEYRCQVSEGRTRYDCLKEIEITIMQVVTRDYNQMSDIISANGINESVNGNVGEIRTHYESHMSTVKSHKCVEDKLVTNYQMLEKTSGDGWNITSVNEFPVTWSQDFAINPHDWNRTKIVMYNFDDDDKIFMTATDERVSQSAAEADSKGAQIDALSSPVAQIEASRNLRDAEANEAIAMTRRAMSGQLRNFGKRVSNLFSPNEKRSAREKTTEPTSFVHDGVITPPGSTFKAIKSAVEKADQTLKDVTEGGTCEGVWNEQAETVPLDDQAPVSTTRLSALTDEWIPTRSSKPFLVGMVRAPDFRRSRAPDDGGTTDDDPMVFQRSQVQHKLLYSPPNPGSKKRLMMGSKRVLLNDSDELSSLGAYSHNTYDCERFNNPDAHPRHSRMVKSDATYPHDVNQASHMESRRRATWVSRGLAEAENRDTGQSDAASRHTAPKGGSSGVDEWGSDHQSAPGRRRHRNKHCGLWRACIAQVKVIQVRTG